MGEEKDIKAFWSAIYKENDFGIEFAEKPSGAQAVGDMESMPEIDGGFDSLFEKWPKLSLHLAVRSNTEDACEAGYWRGANGKCADGGSEEYESDDIYYLYECVIISYDLWLEQEDWSCIPANLATKEKALALMGAGDFDDGSSFFDRFNEEDKNYALVIEWFKEPEFFTKAAKIDLPQVFLYMPESLKTAEICLEAVKQNGFALEDVPEALKTAELCMEAVKKSGSALEYVPEALRTADMCMEAAKIDLPHVFPYMPESLKTADMCMEAVKQDGSALEYVPEALRTEELCIIAAKNPGFFADLDDVLKHVPKALKAKVKKAAKAKG
jgi:tetratricopeptide (TPR) repeat protein